MLCPRCSQGKTVKAKIKKSGQTLFVCQECEATWFARDAISAEIFIDFGTYMEDIGLAPLWEELVISDT